MAHILLTGDGFQAAHFARLEAAGHTLEHHRSIDPDRLQGVLADADGYVMGGDEYVDDVALRRAHHLRVVSFVGVGFGAFMDVAALGRRAIAIRNTPGATSGAVAEATVGLAIGARRRLFALNAALKRGGSIDARTQDFSGAVVGIVGMGGIGSRVARILRRGFDQPVLYTSRSPRPELERELGLEHAPLFEVVGRSDVLIVAVPTTAETVALIGPPLLAACKPGIVIVNPASHHLVDHAAMLAALFDGQVATFVQDGLPPEDVVPAVRGLKAMDDGRVILIPHALAKTPQAWDRTVELAVANVTTFFETAGSP